MTIDSKVVNRAIATGIKPMLRTHGFGVSTARTFWRHTAEKIDVISFQSFDSHLAGGVGCTTYSFAVNLGCYLEYLPSVAPKPPKEQDGKVRPEEFECQLRNRLLNPLNQPEMEERAAKIRDIWYVDPEGNYLDVLIPTVVERITDLALPWFNRFQDPTEVLRTFLEESETNDGTWGFGSKPSPIRSLFTGYAACRLGMKELARKELEAALRTGREMHKKLRLRDESLTSREAEIKRKLAECFK